MRLKRLSATILLIEASRGTLPRGISLPEKDVPILMAAIEAEATHLLTGDIRHFGPYRSKKFEGVAIMFPGDYLRMRSEHC